MAGSCPAILLQMPQELSAQAEFREILKGAGAM